MQGIVVDTQRKLTNNDLGSVLKNIGIEEIRQARKKRLVISMLTVYGDDSSDARGVRTFSVAGILGTQDEWDALKLVWVKRTGGKIFHATDCESGHGEYKDIPYDERFKEYKDLTKILAQTKMIGLGFAMDIDGYKTFMPDPHENGPYYHCFSGVVMGLAETAYFHVPQQTVKFIFDINHKVKYNTAFLYENYLTNIEDWKYSSYLEDELGFATSKTIGIQVADLFAHETMKHFDNQSALNQPHIRESLNALFDTDRFKCFFYTKEYCQNFRNKYDALERGAGQVGAISKNYKKWLSEHNCQDNCENKTRYLIHCETAN